jgi:hypothetical protein
MMNLVRFAHNGGDGEMGGGQWVSRSVVSGSVGGGGRGVS